MIKCICGYGLRFEVETCGVISGWCPSGHRLYLFRLDDGSWETSGARRRRMALERVCEECGQDFTIPAKEYSKSNPQRFCVPCMRRKNRGRNPERIFAKGGRIRSKATWPLFIPPRGAP